jgi:CRP-like cAMP-binding protein
VNMDPRTIPVDNIKSVYLFSGLDDDQFKAITATMQLHRLAERDHIFEYGDKAERFYLVNSGQVKLYRLSGDGHEKVIEIIQPGQTFAEATVFMDKHFYPVSAEALEATELLSFDSATLVHILRNSVDGCFALIRILSQRMHQWINEIDRLTLHNATYRLVAFLIESIPGDVHTSPKIHLTTHKGVIASRLSIQPETLSRILARLEKQGLIHVHGNDILINDLDGLKQHMQQSL